MQANSRWQFLFPMCHLLPLCLCTWIYSLFSSPPSEVKVKISCAWKWEQTSMWTVGLWPCYWKSLVCHPSVWCKPYIVGVFFFHSDNLFTEPARSGEKIQQMSKTCHTAHGGWGGGTQEMSNNTQLTFTFFWGGKIVMLLQMSNSSEDLLQGCRFREQRTFAVCTRLSPWCAPLSRDWTVSASRLKSG